uniref:GCV_T domain-containing protein n=1 Tax=Anopheles dirus TaxID=7168 RepID=A0A182NPT6_9DIPT
MLLRRYPSVVNAAHQRWFGLAVLHKPTGTGRASLHLSVPARAPLTIAPLPDRRFVRVHGPESVTFLQGLLTNDMRHFEHCGAMYAMFLRANGRVFCDTLIYKRTHGEEAHDYLLECDASTAPRLEKHLKLYRLRKKVQIEAVDAAQFRLWVAFSDGVAEEEPLPTPRPECSEGGLQIFKDPRLPRLGFRVLVNSERQPENEAHLDRVFPGALKAETALPYTSFRYGLGVGEGEENLPDGKCFPLECNCDFLHGVSFHKGCYIGQELTARTYHTGVIRKRLMPLELDVAATPDQLPADAEIKNEEGASVGKLRGHAGTRALGLLRIEKVLQPGAQLTLNGIACRTGKPFWWPKDANARA